MCMQRCTNVTWFSLCHSHEHVYVHLYVCSIRSISEHCLLTAFKVLLNLTHDLQLGCYRLGEQKDIMIVILDVLFQVSYSRYHEVSNECVCEVIALIPGLFAIHWF